MRRKQGCSNGFENGIVTCKEPSPLATRITSWFESCLWHQTTTTELRSCSNPCTPLESKSHIKALYLLLTTLPLCDYSGGGQITRTTERTRLLYPESDHEFTNPTIGCPLPGSRSQANNVHITCHPRPFSWRGQGLNLGFSACQFNALPLNYWPSPNSGKLQGCRPPLKRKTRFTSAKQAEGKWKQKANGVLQT